MQYEEEAKSQDTSFLSSCEVQEATPSLWSADAKQKRKANSVKQGVGTNLESICNSQFCFLLERDLHDASKLATTLQCHSKSRGFQWGFQS